MATFSTDFSGYSAGDIVSVGGGDWATQGTLTSWTRQVEVDGTAIGGKRLNVQDTSQDWGSQASAVVNETIGSTSGDIEVLAAFRVSTVANIELDARPFGVPLLIAADNTAYGPGLDDNLSNIQLCEYSTGFTMDFTHGTFAVTTLSNNALHWCRVGRSGTTIRLKFWKNGETEPASWQASVTDTSITTVKAGLGFFDYNASPFIVEWVGIGTGADSAPGPTAGLTLTVEYGGAVGEGQSVNLVASDALVLTVTSASIAGEAEDIFFQLSQPFTDAEGVGEGQTVDLLTQALLTVDVGQGAGAGQTMVVDIAAVLVGAEGVASGNVGLVYSGNVVTAVRTGNYGLYITLKKRYGMT